MEPPWKIASNVRIVHRALYSELLVDNVVRRGQGIVGLNSQTNPQPHNPPAHTNVRPKDSNSSSAKDMAHYSRSISSKGKGSRHLRSTSARRIFVNNSCTFSCMLQRGDRIADNGPISDFHDR